jgi:solute carrier family 25 (mitochondrial S-adenosylmethionine transporter), member 26
MPPTDKEASKPKTSPFRDILASGLSGGVSGVLVDLFLYPLDTIKTRIQASIKSSVGKEAGFLGHIRNSNWKGLYTGVSLNLISLPTGIIYFVIYDTINHHFKDLFENTSHVSLCHMGAGTMAEVATLIVRNPFEVVKQNLQVQNEHHTVKQVFSSVYRNRGFRGLYSGFWSYVLRECPTSAVQMPVYEILKKVRTPKESKLSFWENAQNGAFSAVVAAIFTNPIDVVKTHMMTSASEKSLGLIATFGQIYRVYGFRGYFKALDLRIAGAALSSIIFFSLYEDFKHDFKHKLSSF